MNALTQKLFDQLRKQNFIGSLTVADAASRLGVSFDEAQRALFELMSHAESKLSTTSEGALIFSFPNGVEEKEEGFFAKAWRKTKSFVKGASRFLLRGWITVAVIFYALVFVAIFIALAVAASNADSDDGFSVGGDIIGALMRVVLEAMFWWWHPLTPVYRRAPRRTSKRSRRSAKKDDVPFYEKVNRFVFGQEAPEPSASERQKTLLNEIRAHKGVVGPSDVMRLFNVSRSEAEARLVKAMLDFDGDVKVSDDGGITYHFEKARESMAQGRGTPKNVWQSLKAMPKLTGNSAGSNFMIFGLNAINLIGSMVAIAGGFTVQRVIELIQGLPMSPAGFPIVLGAIPFVFSLWIMAMPLWRWFTQGSAKKKVSFENGRLGVLKRLLANKGKLDEQTLEGAFSQSAERKPSKAEIREILLELGADIDVKADKPTWRFRDLEAEVKALQNARSSVKEATLGEVVYST